MRSPWVRRTAIAGAVALLLVSPVSAHEGGEGAGIVCEPNEVTAGGSVVLAGTGLEADSERQINLVGPDVVVPFGTVTTDAEGMFSLTVTIPAHLPAGTYTFQAIGDETLTTDLAVLAVGGQGPSQPDQGAEAIVPHERSPLEIAVWAVIVLATLGAGLFLVIRSERLVGRPTVGSEPAARS